MWQEKPLPNLTVWYALFLQYFMVFRYSTRGIVCITTRLDCSVHMASSLRTVQLAVVDKSINCFLYKRNHLD